MPPCGVCTGEQGKAIYEKGGMNSANLTDEQQIEAEDDYRICARRGSTEEAKPKRKNRKKQGMTTELSPLRMSAMLEQWVIDKLNLLIGEKLITHC